MDYKIVHPQEICRVLGISRSTCKRWIDAGIIPGHRTPGGHRRVMEHEFLAAIKRLGIPMVEALNPVHESTTPSESETALVSSPEPAKINGGILAVDDNQGFLSTLKLIINQAFPKVPFHGVTNGFTAGTLVERLQPAVVLFDLHMPGLDGPAVCRWLRESPANHGRHIAALTAHSDDPLRVAAFMAAGGDRVFPKPFDEQEMIAYLRSSLEAPAVAT